MRSLAVNSVNTTIFEKFQKMRHLEKLWNLMNTPAMTQHLIVGHSVHVLPALQVEAMRHKLGQQFDTWVVNQKRKDTIPLPPQLYCSNAITTVSASTILLFHHNHRPPQLQ